MKSEIPEVIEAAGPIVTHAFELLHARFENGSLSNRLSYHNTIHTCGVVERATKIGRTMELTEHGIMLIQIAAAFHDTVQGWAPIEREGGIRIRRRHAGLNETLSAAEAVAQMQCSGVEFSPLDKGTVSTAILATIPGWDGVCNTVYQPLLTRDSDDVTRALALADLGSAGMDPDSFAKDGYQLFAEEQLDVAYAISRAMISSEIPLEIQQQYRERLIMWLKSQAGFARGRQECFEMELGKLRGHPLETGLGEIFNHFPESIRRAERIAEDAESTDFRELMRNLDPNAFPYEE